MLLMPAAAFGGSYPTLEVHRFYNVKTGVHLYTADLAEKASIQANLSDTYRYEGVAYRLTADAVYNSQPLYRFYHKQKGFHFYTASDSERDNVINTLSSVYQYEGVAYGVSPTYRTYVHAETAVWRFFNVKTGAHFYTADPVERDNVKATLSSVYRYEGTAFWYYLASY